MAKDEGEVDIGSGDPHNPASVTWRKAAMENLTTLLQESIVTVCELPAGTVTPESRLADLGVDSLAVAEVIVDLEIKLGRELPIDLLRRLDQVETVGDVAEALGDLSGSTPA